MSVTSAIYNARPAASSGSDGPDRVGMRQRRLADDTGCPKSCRLCPPGGSHDIFEIHRRRAAQRQNEWDLPPGLVDGQGRMLVGAVPYGQQVYCGPRGVYIGEMRGALREGRGSRYRTGRWIERGHFRGGHLVKGWSISSHLGRAYHGYYRNGNIDGPGVLYLGQHTGLKVVARNGFLETQAQEIGDQTLLVEGRPVLRYSVFGSLRGPIAVQYEVMGNDGRPQWSRTRIFTDNRIYKSEMQLSRQCTDIMCGIRIVLVDCDGERGTGKGETWTNAGLYYQGDFKEFYPIFGLYSVVMVRNLIGSFTMGLYSATQMVSPLLSFFRKQLAIRPNRALWRAHDALEDLDGYRDDVDVKERSERLKCALRDRREIIFEACTERHSLVVRARVGKNRDGHILVDFYNTGDGLLDHHEQHPSVPNKFLTVKRWYGSRWVFESKVLPALVGHPKTVRRLYDACSKHLTAVRDRARASSEYQCMQRGGTCSLGGSKAYLRDTMGLIEYTVLMRNLYRDVAIAVESELRLGGRSFGPWHHDYMHAALAELWRKNGRRVAKVRKLIQANRAGFNREGHGAA